MLRGFVERTLMPKLEERIARLNLSVSATRKGLRNRLTRLWKGAGAEAPANDVPYPWHRWAAVLWMALPCWAAVRLGAPGSGAAC